MNLLGLPSPSSLLALISLSTLAEDGSEAPRVAHPSGQGENLILTDRPAEEGSSPAQRPPKPMTKAREALAITVALIFILGFVAFWYGMIFGVHHGSITDEPISTTWGPARYALCACLAWLIGRDLRRAHLTEAWATARQITLSILIQNVLVLAVTIVVGLSLFLLFPALDRSWLYLLSGVGYVGNIALLPMKIKYFGIAFLLLLAVSIPKQAMSEEKSYRQGTRNWRDGAWRSLRFGLAHCVMGVPLFGGLALAVPGLWFTLQYFRGGVERSTFHHVVYNWIILAVAICVALWRLH